MDARRPLEILMVEDNPGDVRLAREALKGTETPAILKTVENGEEAIRYLRRRGDYAGAPRPDIVLLDLNLPRKSGREVVEEIKSDPDLRRIPVVILTSSHNENDIRHSYNLHANCYVNKPAELEDFLRTVGAVVDFWSSVVTLPPGE